MTNPRQVDPEFHVLLARSEEILALIKSKRESGNMNLSEVHELNEELSKVLDKMTTMVVPPDTGEA